MSNLYRRFIKGLSWKRIDSADSSLSLKYTAYKSLIAHNTASLNDLSNLEMLLRDRKPFTIRHFIAGTESLIKSVNNIVASLNALCAAKYPELFVTTAKIGQEMLENLQREKKFDHDDFILPLKSLSRERLHDIGGKAANFGEIYHRVGLPVPQGFAVTAFACRHFLTANGLLAVINEKLEAVDIEDTPVLIGVSQEIKALIMAAPLPQDLEAAILAAAGELGGEFGPGLKMSVRSSATCEDSEASFAGQFSSILNVSPGRLLEAYKEVVASTFTPRAIFYRRSKGYSEDDVIMSVLCLAMVDAAVSGVLYTVDPTDHGVKEVIVTAAWGLGVSVVDGSGAVDIYRVDKAARQVKSREVARKQQRVVMDGHEGLRTENLPGEIGDADCLGDKAIACLVDYGLRLEEHFGQALDIEWAIDADGGLFILQARPLNLTVPEAETDAAGPAEVPGASGEHPLLLFGGHCASPGVASGPAHVLPTGKDIAGVPEGSILIAPQTSVSFVAIMGRLKGIVTDLGSVTGHMAAVAREFDLPALVATDKATQTIPMGQEITLDASGRIIYQGRVESLLRRRKKAHPMAGGPVYALAREAMTKIAPLTLTDPHADNFNPQGCLTLHDVIRLAHEISMREMFRIGEYLEGEKGQAVRLRTNLPMILYCMDLGGGLRLAPGKTSANLEDVVSAPFLALLRGMMHPDVSWTGSVGMNRAAMVSLLASSLLSDPNAEGRFGGPNYAVISKEYLNFNARLGYHFAVVDSYCGPFSNENYITFSFKGGLADLDRKARRARLLAVILERLGMNVIRRCDMIRSELREGKAEQISEKLDFLGRLLGASRLLDMALADDSQIPWYADEFFKGNYTFARA